MTRSAERLLQKSIRSLSLGDVERSLVRWTVTPNSLSRLSIRSANSKVNSDSLRFSKLWPGLPPPQLGSKMTTFSRRLGPFRLRTASSRKALAVPPLTVRTRRIKATTVLGPHRPSGSIPTDLWNSLSPAELLAPKMPSAFPISKPISKSFRCKVATSSPRIIGDVSSRVRSPNFHRASSSACRVLGSQTPVTFKPRFCWSARIAASTFESYAFCVEESRPSETR